MRAKLSATLLPAYQRRCLVVEVQHALNWSCKRSGRTETTISQAVYETLAPAAACTRPRETFKPIPDYSCTGSQPFVLACVSQATNALLNPKTDSCVWRVVKVPTVCGRCTLSLVFMRLSSRVGSLVRSRALVAPKHVAVFARNTGLSISWSCLTCDCVLGS